jgi:hypothetical protein
LSVLVLRQQQEEPMVDNRQGKRTRLALQFPRALETMADGGQDGTTRRQLLVLAALGLFAGSPLPSKASTPDGQLTFGVHISLAPTWFDPAETSGIITPFMVLYALHDAILKPMPGKLMEPCLAESWSASADGRTYDFVLRKGVKFHNGEPVTAADVKFSFERYRGALRQQMKSGWHRSRRRTRSMSASGSRIPGPIS